MTIFQWDDIEADFHHGLLLGNGASVAVDSGFSYGSLFDEATSLGHITAPVQDVFDRFTTNDFELVLRRLWQAKMVNEALSVPPGIVDAAYMEVRTALISTVRDIHISHSDALLHLGNIYNFMKRFKTVVSLNYDLIVYWACMLGNDTLGRWFKDGFLPKSFSDDWETLRTPYGAPGTTLVFYPHGNIILSRNRALAEEKITVTGGADLLHEILNNWGTGLSVPLFVCEGTSDHKLNAIKSSSYLRSIYREVLPQLGESLVIYGWSLSDQDDHILQRLSSGRVRKVAVSVHGGDVGFITNAEIKLRNFGITDIVFFDSASSGCWNNP